MDSTPEAIKVLRNHLRKTIDRLCEELENNINKRGGTEQEINECFLRLEDKIQRLNAADDQFLSWASAGKLSVNIENELEDIDMYQEKVLFCRKIYESYKDKKKNSNEEPVAARAQEKDNPAAKLQQRPLKSILKKSKSNNLDEEMIKKLEPEIVNKNSEKKDWCDDPTKIEFAALGTNGFIGQLYDFKRNIYHPKSLFSQDLPPELIHVVDKSGVKIKISNNDLISDRFKLLDINPEQQLSVLSSPSDIAGHAKYLLEEKKCQKIVSSTLLYSYLTKKVNLMASYDELLPYFDKDAFLNIQSTHVIVGMIWGLNCFLTLNHLYLEESKKTVAENLLKTEINYIRGFIESPNGNFEASKRNQNDFYKNLILKLHTDIPTPTFTPSSLENISKSIEFILQIPENIKSRKDVPLAYIMVNLSVFKDFIKPGQVMLTTDVKPIGENYINSITYFFEELIVIKEKLNDFINDIYKYEKYLPDEFLLKAKSLSKEVEEIEAQLKKILACEVPRVRSSKRQIKELMKIIENLKGPGSNFTRITNEVSTFSLYENLSFIDLCLSNNIVILGKKEKLMDIMAKNPNYDSYVFYTSSKLFEVDEETSDKTFRRFLSMAGNPQKNCQYILVDLDIATLETCEAKKVKLMFFKNGKVVSRDFLADQKSGFTEDTVGTSGNFARLHRSAKFSKAQKPLNKVVAKLICPGFLKGNCPRDSLTWICVSCGVNLEFAFDGHFYCNCGKAPTISFEFKCSSANHSGDFLRITKDYPLKEELKKLNQPLKEMNILILGQTGVGKSTWINSITNYFHYDTLEEAQKGGVLCVIPASFTVNFMTNEKVEKRTVKIGDPDGNETTSVVGKSATQGPRTYKFSYGGREIRLIDTPGLGDTRGIDQDRENMKKIVDHIGFLKEIHGICILLQSNSRRIDAMFRFCITELLTHLHKKAARNIIFCLTNSRSAFYAPGDTTAVLENFLLELEINDMISLRRETMFCLDNEAFRYLCSLRYNDIPRTEEDEKIYRLSWDKSVAETKRLFKRIEALEPHSVIDTTTLCNARYRIVNLMKPMADITQTIQINLAAIAEEERRIRNNKESLEELVKKLHIPQIVLVPTALPYPMTVCTSPKCVKYHHLEQSNVTTVDYVQICHDICSLEDISTETYPNEALRKCYIFNFDSKREKCCMEKCRCNWDSHMHITYTQKREEKQVINTTVENEINYKKNDAARLEEHKQQLELTTKEYKQEQDMIMQTCLKFGVFLKENAITPYNDAFKDYLKYLIQQEKNKANKTEADDLVIQNLNDMMSRYEEEVRILEESMKSRESLKNVTPQEITSLERDLFGLKLTGEQIKMSMEVSMASNKSARIYAEQVLPVKAVS